MDRERGNKEKTRLTYNCAHLRLTKESVTFRYTEEGNYIFGGRRRKRERKVQEIFIWGRIRKRRKIPGIGPTIIWWYDDLHMRSGWWREVASVMSFHKIYGLCNWNYDIAELSVDVTITGQTRKDRATQPLTMEGWDEQWGKVESESLSISSFSVHFLFIFSFTLHFLASMLQGYNKLWNPVHNIRASVIKVTPSGIGGVLGSCTMQRQHWCLSICRNYVYFCGTVEKVITKYKN